MGNERKLGDVWEFRKAAAELGPYWEYEMEKTDPSKTYPDGHKLPGTGKIITLDHLSKVYTAMFGTIPSAISSGVLILFAGTFGVPAIVFLIFKLTGTDPKDRAADQVEILTEFVELGTTQFFSFVFTQLAALSVASATGIIEVANTLGSALKEGVQDVTGTAAGWAEKARDSGAEVRKNVFTPFVTWWRERHPFVPTK